MIFDINSFFIVTPLSEDVVPPLQYPIPQILEGDTITGGFAMSDPLPPEATESNGASPATGEVALDYPQNSTGDSPLLPATDTNVGGGISGTDTDSYIVWGWTSILDPVIVEEVLPELAPAGN